MIRINLFRNVSLRNTSFLDSSAWGKINLGATASPLVFAAILIVCSFAAGCSSEKAKTQTATNQTNNSPTAQPVVSPASTPATQAMQAAAKPVHKKAVRRVASTVTYKEKAFGLSFQYPRRYTLKTGAAATELVSSNSGAMNFVQPGGVALAAVTVPQLAYPKSDLASAFFNVSVNKALTAEQCEEFSAPQGDTQPHLAKTMVGDMELQSTEVLVSAENKQQQSKFYHALKNGACYEFALQVATTTGPEDEGTKPVNRDEVFRRLEKILATVKIDPAPELPDKSATDITPENTPTTSAQ